MDQFSSLAQPLSTIWHSGPLPSFWPWQPGDHLLRSFLFPFWLFPPLCLSLPPIVGPPPCSVPQLLLPSVDMASRDWSSGFFTSHLDASKPQSHLTSPYTSSMNSRPVVANIVATSSVWLMNSRRCHRMNPCRELCKHRQGTDLNGT